MCPVLRNAEDLFYVINLSLCVFYVLVLTPVFISAVGSIPDEAKALSLLAPANAVAGMMPGGGLLPTPNPITNPAVRIQTRSFLHICDLCVIVHNIHRKLFLQNEIFVFLCHTLLLC